MCEKVAPPAMHATGLQLVFAPLVSHLAWSEWCFAFNAVVFVLWALLIQCSMKNPPWHQSCYSSRVHESLHMYLTSVWNYVQVFAEHSISPVCLMIHSPAALHTAVAPKENPVNLMGPLGLCWVLLISYHTV